MSLATRLMDIVICFVAKKRCKGTNFRAHICGKISQNVGNSDFFSILHKKDGSRFREPPHYLTV